MVKVSGGDGSSREKAIIISDCDNTEGVQQEYVEISRRFENYKMIRQSLIGEGGKHYDVLLINIDGQEKEIYFDITDFFGKGFEF